MTKFRQKTNLNKVKEIALIFNEFPIEFTHFDIVNHPFIDSPIYVKHNSDTNEFITWDMHNEDDVKKAKAEIHKIIKKTNKYMHFLSFLINKRYASAFFKYTYRFLNEEDYREALLALFTHLEYPNMDKNFTQRQFVKLFQRLPNTSWMEPEDLEHYNNLPETLTIYRGVKPKNKIKAMSWTDDLTTAQWFADRFEKNGKVYQAQINKADILCYTNQRNEHECIIDFTKLENLREMN